MKKRLTILGMIAALLALALGCGKKSAPTSPPLEDPGTGESEIVIWLKQNAYPFHTSKAGSGFNDLMPLKSMIGNARIVALGEATHGTKEFFEMKHRLLEFLVKEMGFNTFAIEATWPESNLVNDYVQTGVGDPARLLAGLYFWTWNTQEVLDMIKWMGSHNRNPGGAPKVSFFGFDMQFPAMAMQNVSTYLQKVDPPRVIWADSLFLPFRPYAGNQSLYAIAPAATKTQCRENLQKVYDHLSSHRAVYEAQSSRAEFARALQSARVAQQGEDHFSTNSVARRDLYMAENTGWLLDQAGPGAKIVLWAHNYHVSVQANPISMGRHLRQRYGKDMMIFGFSVYEGSCNAVSFYSETGGYGPLTQHRVPPPAESYEDYFRRAGIAKMFLDLREIGPGPATDWLFGPRFFRSIGAVYDSNTASRYFYPARLPQEFDVMIYFQETSPSVLLRF